MKTIQLATVRKALSDAGERKHERETARLTVEHVTAETVNALLRELREEAPAAISAQGVKVTASTISNHVYGGLYNLYREDLQSRLAPLVESARAAQG